MKLYKANTFIIILMTALLMSSFTVNATEQVANPLTAGQTPSGLSFDELEAQIDALMYEHVGTSTPGAAIVIVHEGEIIFSRGYGWADIENQIPVDPAITVFEYGSINKPFVWVAAMQLVEQGLLDLDVDVHYYLPGTFVFEKPFTMRDLLNHSAGFPDHLLRLFYNAQTVGQGLGSLEEALLDLQQPQIFTPGTVSAYSNWGAALAAFIVEQISGQDYAAFERGNVLLPANMHNTLNQPDWLGNDAFLSNKATGHTTDGAGSFQENAWSYIPIYPTGAINGTAEDLAAFIIALTPPEGESGPLFEYANTLETLFTPSSLDHVNYPGTHHGFMTYSGVLPAFGHGGGTMAFSTDFAFVPETRFGFVLLTNAVGHMDLMPSIHELLLGAQQTQTPIAGSNLPSTEAVEGRFVSARRYYGNFLEFFSYGGMSPTLMINIRALDESRIQLSIGGFGAAVYVQTEPYVFNIYDSDSPLFASFFPQLRFRVENGVSQIHVGGGSDLTSLPAGRQFPFLIASLVTVIFSVMFFLIAPIVLFILFLIRRKNQSLHARFNYFSTGFLLSGTLIVLNNLILFMQFGINPFRTVAEVAPFIWINYVLSGLIVLLFAGSIWSWLTAGEARGKRKVLFVITSVFTALFIALLHNWNFFVLL